MRLTPQHADQLTLGKLLRLPYGASIKVESRKGTWVDISGAELAALNGLNAELALVDGLVATAAEINRVASVQTRVWLLTGTGAITEALSDGRINLLNDVGGDTLVTLTLPNATGSGGRYKFFVSVTNTSTYVIKVSRAADTMAGSIMGSEDTDSAVLGWETAASSDTITLDGTQRGGKVGDWIELIDILPNVWAVRGFIVQSGATEATPFSATVS